MRPVLRLLLILPALLAGPAGAHEIGVATTELTEIAAGTDRKYLLRVEASPGVTSRFPAPVLPAQCDIDGGGRGVQGTLWKSFEFSCAGGLGPGDVLTLPWLRDGVMLRVRWADGTEVTRLFRNEAGVIVVPLAELNVSSASWTAAARRYTALGIEHILEGFDHLLFVFALLLIVSSGWLLVKTITAFTLAHSITLALATLGIVTVPSRPVEAVIALSIVLLAVEIVHARQGRVGLSYRAPWLVAFGFGLLHGFGFAGALSEIGLPPGEIPIALLFFNVGVEIGQLIFVLAVLLLAKALALLRLDRIRGIEVLPVYFIGTVAMYWVIERIVVMVLPS